MEAIIKKTPFSLQDRKRMDAELKEKNKEQYIQSILDLAPLYIYRVY